MLRIPPALAAALLAPALLAARPAAAQPVVSSLASDAAFATLQAAGGFTKLLGGNVRWGNAAANGDWETALVNPADLPRHQQQVAWGTAQDGTPAGHDFSFRVSRDGGWFAELYLPGPGADAFGAVDDLLGGQSFNALFIRGYAGAGQGMRFLGDLTLRFLADGEELALAPFTADADAEYLTVVDPRLGQGFVLTGRAALAGDANARGSNPAYQFKVGVAPVSAVPEPGTWALLGTGLIGLGVVARRRA